MASRPVIYQLFPRLFGNRRTDGTAGGSLQENGCGKFADLDGKVLDAIKRAGFTHLWITGVPEHASGTSHPDRPQDDPAILKGVAGSPYAVKDYFDVCPDLAVDAGRRRDEFGELLQRCARHGLRVFVDFVPNHVARTYESDVRPGMSFGSGDDPSVFFDRDNHFFYLRQEDGGGGPPLRLPVTGEAFMPEAVSGKVTGNNAVTWSPSKNDWYETVKLNYGHDFTSGRDTSHLPGPDADPAEVPKTWRTMDQVLGWWQSLGVAGFRVDMAHMIPMEFWRWVIGRCRRRDPEVWFFGEAYDGDPMKLTEGDVLEALLSAGFDSVYDHPPYKVLKGIYDGAAWANDLDPLAFQSPSFHRLLRYAENHDEVRLASPLHWGGNGMEIGKPVSAILLGIGRGPLMLYNGQEVGEPALERMGYGGGDGRTSIFDYGTMPAVARWLDGRSTEAEIGLRDWYVKLLGVLRETAFTDGEFYGLNHANAENPAFGRIGDESWSGHWLYAFLRHVPGTRKSYLIVVNLHGTEALRGVRVRIPEHARSWLGRDGVATWRFRERMADDWKGEASAGDLPDGGLSIPDLPPFMVRMMEIG